MDPITATIVGALMAGALKGITEVGKTTVTDAYAKLKGLLYRKFSARSGVMQALAQLEAKPDSSPRQGVLHEELAAVNALQDAEVLAAARYLHVLVQQQQIQFQQQQGINIQRSTLQGSIYQAGGNQYNVDANKLVGPGTRRGVRRVVSVLLIVSGLITGIPAAGMLPFFDAIVNSVVQNPLSGSEASSFTAFGTSVHIMIYTMIGLGVVMVIGGILLLISGKRTQVQN
jgi:hypothetical protein